MHCLKLDIRTIGWISSNRFRDTRASRSHIHARLRLQPERNLTGIDATSNIEPNRKPPTSNLRSPSSVQFHCFIGWPGDRWLFPRVEIGQCRADSLYTLPYVHSTRRFFSNSIYLFASFFLGLLPPFTVSWTPDSYAIESFAQLFTWLIFSYII